MELLIGGQWVGAVSGRQEDVTSPFDGSVVGSVSAAGLEDVDAALASATEGAKVWRRTPAHQRMRILLQADASATRNITRGDRCVGLAVHGPIRFRRPDR